MVKSEWNNCCGCFKNRERVENRNHDHLVQSGAEARTSEEHLGEGAPAGSVMAFDRPLNPDVCHPLLVKDYCSD